MQMRTVRNLQACMYMAIAFTMVALLYVIIRPTVMGIEIMAIVPLPFIALVACFWIIIHVATFIRALLIIVLPQYRELLREWF